MVEENFVFQSFETLQNKGFSLGFLVIRFTMIEESFSWRKLKKVSQLSDVVIYAYTWIRNAPGNLVKYQHAGRQSI